MGTPTVSLLVWICMWAQAGWLAWAVVNFVRRNDEMPVVITGFLFYCGSYRFLGAYYGLFVWGSLAYGLDVSANFASAGIALALITFGESVLLASYRFWQNKVLEVKEQKLPGIVVSRLRLLVLVLTIVGIPMVLFSQIYVWRLAAKGLSLAFQISSYAQEFPMVLVALAVLVFLAWRFGALRNRIETIAAAILLVVIGYLTFAPSGRFMFLGWILGGTYIVSTRWFGLKRIPVLSAGVLVALVLFGVAGAMRYPNETDKLKAGLERAKVGEDANMLEGLVYLMQVYPKMLPYRYGEGQLEILERPIPRALWPGKPVGGYMNRLGLFNAGSSVTVGISPTLFGSFYTEGGWVAVFILCVIYGWGIARIVRFSAGVRPLFGVLIRAAVLAGLIPLLRGGDLPGIFAWIGMAFWPLLIFLWWNKPYLRPFPAQTRATPTGRRLPTPMRSPQSGVPGARPNPIMSSRRVMPIKRFTRPVLRRRSLATAGRWKMAGRRWKP